jgi:RNA polymerase sigma factor (sigma-70 family)
MADEEDQKENNNFEALLRWLDPNPEEAARKYEEIRERLIKTFTWYRFVDVEGLADEVMDRVENKITEIVGEYSGDPKPYFYAVARNVAREKIRERKRFSSFEEGSGETSTSTALEENADSIEQEALNRCLEQLNERDRQIILAYYRYEQEEKTDYHLRLATELGITRNALWIKVCRIRLRLEKCIRERVDESRLSQ